MIFETTYPCLYLLHQCCQRWVRVIAFAQESIVHGYVFYAFHHSTYVKYTRCTGSRICPIYRTSPSSYHIADAATDGIDVLLWRYHVYMSVKVSWRADSVLSCSSFCACRKNHIAIYFVHRIWITCFSNSSNPAVLYADVSFDYSNYRIENNRVCNEEVKSSIRICNTRCLCHPIS